jgi:hypothetical protein
MRYLKMHAMETPAVRLCAPMACRFATKLMGHQEDPSVAPAALGSRPDVRVDAALTGFNTANKRMRSLQPRREIPLRKARPFTCGRQQPDQGAWPRLRRVLRRVVLVMALCCEKWSALNTALTCLLA